MVTPSHRQFIVLLCFSPSTGFAWMFWCWAAFVLLSGRSVCSWNESHFGRTATLLCMSVCSSLLCSPTAAGMQLICHQHSASHRNTAKTVWVNVPYLHASSPREQAKAQQGIKVTSPWRVIRENKKWDENPSHGNGLDNSSSPCDNNKHCHQVHWNSSWKEKQS